jgi:hypothetical protein
MRKHIGYFIFLIMVNILLAGCGQSSTTLNSETTKVSEKDGMVMVYVPAGVFLMGSDSSDLMLKRMNSRSTRCIWMHFTLTRRK